MRLSPILLRNRAIVPLVAAAIVVVVLAASPARGQQQQFNDLVRNAITKQINDKVNPPYYSWMKRTYAGKHTRVEFIVDTPNGRLRRVCAIDGKPLNEEQRRREAERVQNMIDPEELSRGIKSQKEEAERTNLLLKSIPNAFDFQYKDTTIGPDGHTLVTLTFKPRPGFDPPNHETMVFLGMKGEVIVDETAERLVKIDGTLFKDVTFGWGIFGRLFSGGRFVVEQIAVTPTHWVDNKNFMKFDGRVLLFKSIHIQDQEYSWDFRAVPPMTVDQALNYLAKDASLNQDASLLQESSPSKAPLSARSPVHGAP
jgi:hypothetical protein